MPDTSKKSNHELTYELLEKHKELLNEAQNLLDFFKENLEVFKSEPLVVSMIFNTLAPKNLLKNLKGVVDETGDLYQSIIHG